VAVYFPKRLGDLVVDVVDVDVVDVVRGVGLGCMVDIPGIGRRHSKQPVPPSLFHHHHPPRA